MVSLLCLVFYVVATLNALKPDRFLRFKQKISKKLHFWKCAQNIVDAVKKVRRQWQGSLLLHGHHFSHLYYLILTILTFLHRESIFGLKVSKEALNP